MVTEQTAPTHVLPQPVFRSVAAGAATAADVAGLAEAERSWRMAALFHVITTLRPMAATGPLDPIGDAAALFTAAAAADEQAAEEVAGYPLIGIWIAHVLRRLGGIVGDDCPLWLDAGHLHALAAASAIRAGLDFALRVPVRSGAVVLPTLGMAAFPGLDARAAEVRRAGGDVTITAGDRTVRLAEADPQWRPIPRCRSEVDGAAIAFTIDDVDPYRDLRGYSAPEPLGPGELARWQRSTGDAWEILVRQDRGRAEAVAAAVTTVVPLPAAEPYRPLSASCDEAFAAVMASAPDDAAQLAVTLVHETQHVVLGALTHLIEFVDQAGGPLVYAPWRDDPRPLSGLLQGAYAFAGVTGFFRHRRDPVAQFEFALWRHQLTRVLAVIGDDARLSGHGHELVDGLAGTVAGWAASPVAPEIRRLAVAAADDHHGQWRAWHVGAPAGWVEQAARAYPANRACPPVDADPGIEPVTDTRARWLDGRAVLARMRLGEPEAFAVLAKDPADVARQVPGTLPVDVALIAGDPGAARDGYRRRLIAEPDDARAWVGLGLALAALGTANPTLTHRPELLRALARRLPTVDPLALADWCAAAYQSC